MAVLSYLGPEGAAVFELGGVYVTIGRKKGNDLAVDWDPAVSGRHAELEQIPRLVVRHRPDELERHLGER